ncbi:hypothetical protein SFRURICE_021308 [Spodoptera frugiperda]|nr:hypothetical protein SFRURICE_021308 [Spodoptera frugiperda]
MTNTCPNTLPYLYDGHFWTEYASYFVIIFKYVSEKNFVTRPIPALCRTIVGQWLGTLVPRRYIDTAVQLHGKRGVQNLTLVDFYLKSLVYAEGIGRASKFFSKTHLKIMTK